MSHASMHAGTHQSRDQSTGEAAGARHTAKRAWPERLVKSDPKEVFRAFLVRKKGQLTEAQHKRARELNLSEIGVDTIHSIACPHRTAESLASEAALTHREAAALDEPQDQGRASKRPALQRSPLEQAWLSHATGSSCAMPQHPQALPGLLAGSAKPHASVEQAAAHCPQQHRWAPTGSMRQLEPELDSVLSREPLPLVHVPRTTAWEEPPERITNPPGPFTTEQLIPSETVTLVERQARANRECLSRGRRGSSAGGSSSMAKRLRPEALILEQHQTLNSCGWGYTWQKRPEEDLWDVVQPSSWPDDPPSTSLDAERLLADADKYGYTDRQFIAWSCHGFPGSKLPSGGRAVIGRPHCGALESAGSVAEMDQRDRSEGWLTEGMAFPTIWPCFADCINIVWQHGKPRLTIDKSIMLSSSAHPEPVDSYNSMLDLDEERASVGTLALPRVWLFWRATAILLTCGIEVLVGKFDLFAYFRAHGKQRAAVHQSARSLESLISFDLRVNFGEQDGMDHCCRGSECLVFFIRIELTRLCKQYPPKDAKIIEWLLKRLSIQRDDGEQHDPHCRFAVTWFYMQYVDDAGLAAISYPLFDTDGAALLEIVTAADGSQSRRQQISGPMLLKAAAGVCNYYGHGTPDKKFFPMSRELELLGEHGDTVTRTRALPKEKADHYLSNIRLLLSGGHALPNKLIAVDDSALNSIAHKLTHATSVHPLGRMQLFNIRHVRRLDKLLTPQGRVLTRKAVEELKWWIHQLEHYDSVQIPLASRYGFPSSSDSTIISYSDASREPSKPSTSGHGAWALITGIFFYMHGLWSAAEMASYSINVLEAHISSVSSRRFILEARALSNSATHSLVFIDNSTAECIFENGRQTKEGLNDVNSERVKWLHELNVHQASKRVASEDNLIADELSRNDIDKALSIPRSLGLRIVKLELSHDEMSMSGITPTWA